MVAFCKNAGYTHIPKDWLVSATESEWLMDIGAYTGMSKIPIDALNGVKQQQEVIVKEIKVKKKKSGFQPPILHEPIGTQIELTLFQLSPPDYLEAELDQGLLNSVAADWIRTPILVCPEDRIVSDQGQLYYPYDGRRRVLALWWLHDNGYQYNGVPIADVPVSAVLREDLTPAIAHKLAFRANKERSDNPITDVAAIQDAAQRLDVSPFTKEGRKAIAADLRTTAGAVGRIAKGLQVEHVIFDAFRKGQIAQGTLNAILDLKNKDDRLHIAERLRLGEELSTNDIAQYRQAFTQATLVDAMESRPMIDFGQDNISLSIEKLEEAILTTDPWLLIEDAINLLKALR